MPFTAVAEKVITASVLKAPLLPKEPAFIIPRPAVRLMPFNLGNRLAYMPFSCAWLFFFFLFNLETRAPLDPIFGMQN